MDDFFSEMMDVFNNPDFNQSANNKEKGLLPYFFPNMFNDSRSTK